MNTKLSLVVAALIPVAAVGAPEDSQSQSQSSQQQASSQLKVEKQKLQQAVPATAIMDEQVVTEDGTEVGSVTDVIVSKDGKVKNFLVETESPGREDAGMQPAGQQQGERAQEQRTSGENDWEEAERDMQRTAETAGQKTESAIEGDREVKLEPRDVKYDDQNDRVSVSKQKMEQAEAQTYESGAQDELKLSEIVGMEVNLQDDESFGRVEDVMLSQDNTEVVALVVDNWDGLEKHRRALPMQQAQIDAQNGEINYQASESDVQNLPEFNLDNYEDDGWDLSDWTT